jgi:3-amino-5-hydroxybenzoate synthase
MAAFSFQNYKLLTAGEGGMLLCADEATFRQASIIANCGRDPEGRGYAHVVEGSNYRMSELQGAVLNAQLDRLEEQGRCRQRNADYLSARLAEIGGVHPQERDETVNRHSYYMYVFTYEPEAFAGISRDLLVEALVAEGVPAVQMYPRVHDTTHYAPALARCGGSPDMLPPSPISQAIAEHGIWIHHRVLLGEENLTEQVAQAILKIRCSADDIVGRQVEERGRPVIAASEQREVAVRS